MRVSQYTRLSDLHTSTARCHLQIASMHTHHKVRMQPPPHKVLQMSCQCCLCICTLRMATRHNTVGQGSWADPVWQGVIRTVQPSGPITVTVIESSTGIITYQCFFFHTVLMHSRTHLRNGRKELHWLSTSAVSPSLHLKEIITSLIANNQVNLLVCSISKSRMQAWVKWHRSLWCTVRRLHPLAASTPAETSRTSPSDVTPD